MYAELTDLEARLRRSYAALYGDDDTGEVDEDLATADLVASSAEIDGALAARYAVPVTAEGALPLLKAWTLDLTAERAWGRSESDDVPAKVKTAAKIVRDQLDKLADVNGKFRLPADPAENADGVGSDVMIDRDRPVFTRDKMKGF